MSKTIKPSVGPHGTAAPGPEGTSDGVRAARKSSKPGRASRGKVVTPAEPGRPRKGGPLSNPRHEAFAQAVAQGYSGAQAYRENISDQCSTTSAMVCASRLLSDVKVALRVEELRASFREVLEKRIGFQQQTAARFLAEIIMTPLSEVSINSPLCQEWSRTDSESSSTERIKMPSKLDALDKLNKMAGWYEAEKVENSGKIEIIIRE